MPSFRTVLLPTADIAASRDLYRQLLGVDPVADEAYYVGFEADDQHIGLVPGLPVVRPQLHVDDLGAATGLVVAAGGTVVEDPREVGAGRTVAVVRDASGAEFGLIHDGDR